MKRAALLLGFVSLVAVGCDDQMAPPGEPALSLDAQLRQNFGQWGAIPIAPMPQQDPAMVTLGRTLFFDKVLSGNKDMACASCHQPQASLGDGISLAVGTGGWGTGTARRPGSGRTFGMRAVSLFRLRSTAAMVVRTASSRSERRPLVYATTVGSRTVNVDPTPGVLVTDTSPPISSAKLFTSANPSPVPP